MNSRTHGVTVDTAFELLRSHARRDHLRIGTLAHDIVTGAAEVPRPGSLDSTQE